MDLHRVEATNFLGFTYKRPFRNCVLSISEEWYTTDAEPIVPPGLVGNTQTAIQRYDFKTCTRTLAQNKPLISAELYMNKVDPSMYKYADPKTVYQPQFMQECPTYRFASPNLPKEITTWVMM